jgi:hypothetical protein
VTPSEMACVHMRPGLQSRQNPCGVSPEGSKSQSPNVLNMNYLSWARSWHKSPAFLGAKAWIHAE